MINVIHEIFCFSIKTINTAASELQLKFDWSRCPAFRRCELDAVLSNLETVYCLCFKAQQGLPAVLCQGVLVVWLLQIVILANSAKMANLICFLLQFTCMNNDTEWGFGWLFWFFWFFFSPEYSMGKM